MTNKTEHIRKSMEELSAEKRAAILSVFCNSSNDEIELFSMATQSQFEPDREHILYPHYTRMTAIKLLNLNSIMMLNKLLSSHDQLTTQGVVSFQETLSGFWLSFQSNLSMISNDNKTKLFRIFREMLNESLQIFGDLNGRISSILKQLKKHV